MPTFPKRKSALPRPLAETMLLPCRRSLRRFALLSVGLLCVTIGYAALVYVRETVLRDVRGVRVDRAWDTVLAKTLEDGVVGLKPSVSVALQRLQTRLKLNPAGLWSVFHHTYTHSADCSHSRTHQNLCVASHRQCGIGSPLTGGQFCPAQTKTIQIVFSHAGSIHHWAS